MNHITIKPNKHLIIIQLDSWIPEKAKTSLLEDFEKFCPDIKVLVSNPGTEITLLSLEDEKSAV